MAEEQRCQEGHRLCANNCGFFGSPATLDLCSKCYRTLRLKEDRATSAKAAVKISLRSTPAARDPVVLLEIRPSPPHASSSAAVADSAGAEPARPNRCDACRKRMGLTGFRCRCGDTFCGTHRYPEMHACTVDYKSMGREEIARANPVVKAEKLEKI